jgi:hypothetical protein
VRSPVARIGIAAAAAAAIIVLFVVFAGDEGGVDAATALPQSTQLTTNDEPHARPATQSPGVPAIAGGKAAAPTLPIERVVVRSGKPAGGVKRLEYEKGERVRFSIRSDRADEVHIHGFDITRDLPANRSVQFRFRAGIEGVFEVELHDAHVTIAKLRITP